MKTFDAKNHIHLLDGQPLIGTTTLIDDVYPPNLAWWSVSIGLQKLGWPRQKDDAKKAIPLTERQERFKPFWATMSLMESNDMLALMDEAYKAHDQAKRQAGKKGTEEHARVEDWIKACIKNFDGQPIAPNKEKSLNDFVKWAQQDVKRFLWSEAQLYSRELWVGGICDFAFIDKEGRVIIGDRKTSKDIYPKHYYQVAGYGIQFKENGALDDDGNVIVKPLQVDGYMIFQQKDGEAKVEYRRDVEKLERIFRHTVEVYKDKNDIMSVTIVK